MFSILATELSADVKTYEDLIEKLENSPITPKPKCIGLDLIFGWKQFINNHMTSEPPLANFTKYNSFMWSIENDNVKFRAKRLPQDTEYEPRAGIRLVKEGMEVLPIEAVEPRLEHIPFDRILRTVRIMVSDSPLSERYRIQESWDKLRDRLEALPKKQIFHRRMILTELPKQRPAVPSLNVPENLLETPEDRISGELFEESIEEGNLDEIVEGVDVCVYTDSAHGRPWVGKVKQMLPGRKFVIHWYGRKSGRGNLFSALSNKDNTPYLSELDMNSIMFWAFTEMRRESSFVISKFWLENLRLEYERLDNTSLV